MKPLSTDRDRRDAALMSKIEDKNTRYFMDVDLESRAIPLMDYGQRDELLQNLPDTRQHRVFLTKGQYGIAQKKLTVCLFSGLGNTNWPHRWFRCTVIAR